MREALGLAQQRRRVDSRRNFLVGSCASLVAGLGAGYLAAAPAAPAAAPEPAAPDLDLAEARRLAGGTIEELVENWPIFLATAELNSSDPAVMFGVCRLACAASNQNLPGAAELSQATSDVLASVPQGELRVLRDCMLASPPGQRSR